MPAYTRMNPDNKKEAPHFVDQVDSIIGISIKVIYLASKRDVRSIRQAERTRYLPGKQNRFADFQRRRALDSFQARVVSISLRL